MALRVQLVETVLPGSDERVEAGLWAYDLPRVCVVPNGASVLPNREKYSKEELDRQPFSWLDVHPRIWWEMAIRKMMVGMSFKVIHGAFVS